MDLLCRNPRLLYNLADDLKNWKPENENNIWEFSGLYEGDIMRSETSDKNGLLDENAKWPLAIVPYYIDENDFTEYQIKKIKRVIDDYHKKTCVRFRPYKIGDVNYVIVKGDQNGCWSYVGKQNNGQVVNFQNPECLRTGTIIHEFLHVLGFYHQQSSFDRDDWIHVNWDNIRPGKENNFQKYDEKRITDYGIGYDYESVMHYGATAFSKNGKKTIVPKMENITLGQRYGFSEKDIAKLNLMYKTECETREKTIKKTEDYEDIVSWILSF